MIVNYFHNLLCSCDMKVSYVIPIKIYNSNPQYKFGSRISTILNTTQKISTLTTINNSFGIHTFVAGKGQWILN